MTSSSSTSGIQHGINFFIFDSLIRKKIQMAQSAKSTKVFSVCMKEADAFNTTQSFLSSASAKNTSSEKGKRIDIPSSNCIHAPRKHISPSPVPVSSTTPSTSMNTPSPNEIANDDSTYPMIFEMEFSGQPSAAVNSSTTPATFTSNCSCLNDNNT
jgi:hypothetical protein